MAAGLLLKLKEECEAQHARAEAAESQVADLQSQIETLTAELEMERLSNDVYCERTKAAELKLAQLTAGGRSEARATWQPIETAPRDGTRVLAKISTGPSPRIIQFQATFGWLDDASYWPSVTDIHGWMPLPDPPSASGEGQ
jgi:hypothetical protein